MARSADLAQASAAHLVIRGVAVVNTRDGSLELNQDVHLAGERILSVQPSTGQTPPPAVQVVQAAGQYLVPGFADMHAHPLGANDPSGRFGLMLAYGVTGFRQMSGSARMLAARGAGTLMPAGAPRLLGLPGQVLTPLNAGAPDSAVARVREQRDLGADFIKAALVTSEAFYAAQAEAGRLGIPILGHLPSGIDVARASGDGMRSIEHLGPGAGLLACCSTDQEAVDREVAALPAPKMPPAWLPIPEPLFDRVIRTIVVNPLNRSQPGDVAILARAAATFAEDAAAALAQRFVRDGTWQVPTLIRSRTMHLCDDPAFRDDPDLRYVAPPTLRTWTKAADKFARFPASSRETFRAAYATLLALIKVLDEAGVRMLAGSDSGGAAWELPGIALHQEFDELARAGLTPLRVLQMTTSDAADFLGAADVMGSVAPGQHADLVLLGANPVESVDHLHRISGVVRGGRYYPKAELDALREKAAAGRSVR